MDGDDFVSDKDWNFMTDQHFDDIQSQKVELVKLVGVEKKQGVFSEAINAFAELIAVLGIRS